MEDRGWKLFLTHGNKFQKGLPDAYALHEQYGERWIDFKVKGSYSFTEAQKNTWCDWYFNYKKGIWILIAGTQEEYDKLFKTCNFLDYWKNSWGCPEEFASPVEPCDLAETLIGEWKEIEGFPKYFVSDDGRVYSEKSGRILNPDVCNSGHLRVTLCHKNLKKRFFVHSLVLESFIGPRPDDKECCHIDGDPSNNQIDNLMWGTSQENALHRSLHGRAHSKLNEEGVKFILNSNQSVSSLAKQFDVCESAIRDIRRGHTWSWLTGIEKKPQRRKLTDEEVIAIFNSSGTNREIAEKFNVNHTTVGSIKRKQSHKHLLDTIEE